MRSLRTIRLRLLPVTAANARSLWHVLQQPDLRAFQDLPNVSAEAFDEMVAKRPKVLQHGVSGRFEWLIYPSRSRKPAGWISLRVAERDLATGEIGYSIVREARRQGIASEAVGAVLDEAFDQAELSRINAYCVPENHPSRRLLKRMGFRFEGILPHGATVSGRAVDVLMHCIDREAWRQSGNSMVMPASAYPA